MLPSRLPVLTREPVRLRAFRETDVDLVLSVAGDPLIPLITTVPATGRREDASAYIARQQERVSSGVGFSFAIADAAEDEAVGQIGPPSTKPIHAPSIATTGVRTPSRPTRSTCGAPRVPPPVGATHQRLTIHDGSEQREGIQAHTPHRPRIRGRGQQRVTSTGGQRHDLLNVADVPPVPPRRAAHTAAGYPAGLRPDHNVEPAFRSRPGPDHNDTRWASSTVA